MIDNLKKTLHFIMLAAVMVTFYVWIGLEFTVLLVALCSAGVGVLYYLER